ncbi:MAG: hypothetical protein IPM99_19195 [Rubrivivax sp.]|nr:hypothetical protein [Rubrivivax sp.]
MSFLKPHDRTLAERSLDAVDATRQQLTLQARHASDRTVASIHADPLKATLIAAAAGALLAGIVCALSRRP